MPAKTKKVTRSGKSHAHPSNKRQPQHFTKVYWPYIPLIALVVIGLIAGVGFRPNSVTAHQAVLSYATEMSQGGLLANTNTERTNRGLAALTINAKLSQAAQAKANDMVARDYWSHNTPDGKEPWTFIASTGYVYQKAGENLAYGFSTSNETVVGWMNSAGHRANILDVAYKEVGFGFANSSNYVGTGQETVVVAMYANPQVQSAQTTTPPKTQKPTSSQPVVETSAPETIVEQQPEAPSTREQFASDNLAVANVDVQPTRITRLQSLTGGIAPWSAVALSAFTALVVGLWLLKHAVIVKRALISGEAFVMHHPAIDVTVAVFVALAIYLSSSSGVIK